MDGIRDEGPLDSALSAPFRDFDGAEPYPSLVAKIARCAYGLVRDHPFVDGNERIGTYLMLVPLEPNHIGTDFTDADVVRIGFETANGKMGEGQSLELILTRAK
ncbi:MAG: Fic family protein [Deltaproteobacteria bacterium]|nr:Fic family protein [Deltaproteobacteria bacterium]